MAQEVINDNVCINVLSSHTVLIQCLKTLTSLYKAVTAALCVEAAAQRLAAQLESTNRRAGQDRTEIPWAVAGA